MKKALPIGVMDYKELKQNGYYFVDKTLMIKDYLERKTKVTLITRPRRFGKSLNMSMMAEFFDIIKDSKELFKDTKIMETEYAKEMNQWPVIFISFANAKGHYANVVEMIKMVLRNEYDKYEYIFDTLTKIEKIDYERNFNAVTNLDSNLNYIGNSLAFLMKMLEKYYGKKVMVLIDEYDTPFIEAHVNDFYDEIKDALSSLLHNTLKTSLSLQYAMLTGIQRVAKENIFSNLNNLVVCTVNDREYSEYFGFTEKETKELLNYYDLELNEKVKNMYDGYRFGNYDIYNPWSIINYANRKELQSYWVNTSSNSMIKQA